MSDLWIANVSSLLGAVTSFRAYVTRPHINMWIKKKKKHLVWWHNLFFWHKSFYVVSSHKWSIVVNQGRWIKCDTNFRSDGWTAACMMFYLKHVTRKDFKGLWITPTVANVNWDYRHFIPCVVRVVVSHLTILKTTWEISSGYLAGVLKIPQKS